MVFSHRHHSPVAVFSETVSTCIRPLMAPKHVENTARERIIHAAIATPRRTSVAEVVSTPHTSFRSGPTADGKAICAAASDAQPFKASRASFTTDVA